MGPWQHNIEMSAPPQPAAARSLRTKELSRVFCAVLDPDATPLGGYPQSGAYRPWMPVDVRDDAFCHVSMLESTKVKTGERYIAWSTEKQPPEQICASIDRLLPELNHYGGTLIEDERTGFPDKIKAREDEFRGNWAQTDLRNDRMCELVGITFRPFDESLRDCVESLISVGEVQVKTRDSKL